MKGLMTVLMLIAMMSLACSDIKTDQYAIEKGTDGIVYRINKKTGNVVAIIGTKAYEISMPENWQKGQTKISDSKNWPKQTIPLTQDNIFVNLRTCWRDGKMHYVVTIPHSTAAEKLRSGYGKSVTPMFQDKSGFTLIQAIVPLSGMTRMVGFDNKVNAYMYEGSIECAPSTYADLEDLTVRWNFD